MTVANILLVAGNHEFRCSVCGMLSTGGYVIREANDAAGALALLRDMRVNLVLLDTNTRAELGLCRTIRRTSTVPIVILGRGAIAKDKIRGLAAGADEYIVKPFERDELLARMRAVLRRSGTSAITPGVASDDGDVVVDVDARKLMVNGRKAHLSPTEFQVLTYLVANKGRLITYGELLDIVWGPTRSERAHDNLRVVINKLRKKIERDPTDPKYITTEPWVGYRFERGVEPRAPQVEPRLEKPAVATGCIPDSLRKQLSD